MRTNAILAITTICLIASCDSHLKFSKKDSASIESKVVNAIFPTAYASEIEIPKCNAPSLGRLIYVESLSEFQVCRSTGWLKINLQGAAGAKGEKGAQGEAGAAAPTPKASILTTTTSAIGIATTTPKATLQIGERGALFESHSNFDIGYNVYFDGTDWRRLTDLASATLIEMQTPGTQDFAVYTASDNTPNAESIPSWLKMLSLAPTKASVSGALGVGISNPASTLHVYSDTNPTTLTIENDVGNANVTLIDGNDQSFMWQNRAADSNLRLLIDGATKWVVNSNGGLQLGASTSSTEMFEVNGTSRIKGMSGTTSAGITVDSTGAVGINETVPARVFHINDVMRIEPRSTPPTSGAMGDIYVDDSGAFCFHDGTSWTVAGGSGSCI